jgi:hypothetical protein
LNTDCPGQTQDLTRDPTPPDSAADSANTGVVFLLTAYAKGNTVAEAREHVDAARSAATSRLGRLALGTPRPATEPSVRSRSTGLVNAAAGAEKGSHAD